MIKIIDLTIELKNEMPHHPYDYPFKLNLNRFINKDGYQNTMIESGMHIGTHIDAPAHFIEGGKSISDFSIESFLGNGIVIDVSGKSLIMYDKEYENLDLKGKFVLFLTGHYQKWDTEEYYTHYPIFDGGLINFLVEKEIKGIGMDTPSPDIYPFDSHKLLFMHDVLIIENLTNIEKVLNISDFEVMAFPLKINAEGSLARVIVREINK